MVIDMNEQQLNTVAQLRAFLNGTQEVQFEPQGERSQRYAFPLPRWCSVFAMGTCPGPRRGS